MVPERPPLKQDLEGRLNFHKGKNGVHHRLDASLGYQFHGFPEFLLDIGARAENFSLVVHEFMGHGLHG